MSKKFVRGGEVPKEATGSDILETSRNAALESAASLLETLAHARKLKQRARATMEDATEFHEKDGQESTSRDVLFDMLRLNASYLNELAKLGNQHKSLIQRALENLYSAASANSKHPSVTELEFDHNTPNRQFIVQNDAAPARDQVLVEWTNVLATRDAKATDPFSFYDRDGNLIDKREDMPNQHCIAVPVWFGIPHVITMTIDSTSFLARRYHTELVIKLRLDGERVQIRRVPVKIDMRGKG